MSLVLVTGLLIGFTLYIAVLFVSYNRKQRECGNKIECDYFYEFSFYAVNGWLVVSTGSAIIGILEPSIISRNEGLILLYITLIVLLCLISFFFIQTNKRGMGYGYSIFHGIILA